MESTFEVYMYSLACTETVVDVYLCQCSDLRRGDVLALCLGHSSLCSLLSLCC